jgi:AcrR family transcriptional regulator
MTRERILKAAGQLIAEHGIDAVTITDIANAADVSRGNLYSHFDSKEALLNAIVKPMVTQAVEQIRKLKDLPPAHAIAGLLRVHATLWREIPGALSVAHQFHSELAAASASTEEAQPHNVTQIFQQAADAGILRVTPALAIKIFNGIAVPLLELCQEAPDPDELFVESMLKLLLNESHAEAQESKAL